MNTAMLNSGALFYDKIILADNCHFDNIEFNRSAYEDVPVNLSLSSTTDFSCDTAYINTDLLQQATGEPWNNNESLTFEYYVPIMIQARWHKKARVRKKWLRRYGMKKDQVKVNLSCTGLSVDGQDNCWELQMDGSSFEYLWRPDQKRREIKIELV